MTSAYLLPIVPQIGDILSIIRAKLYKEFLMDWMGFDREAKRHFLTDFSVKPGLFCGILYLRRSYESRESVVH